MAEPIVATPTISAAEFEKFREYFYRKTGIHFESSKRYFVDKRLLERTAVTGHTTFTEYFSHLRFGNSGDELQRLTNLMTVNETYFFREKYQFDCLVQSILPDVVARRTDRTPIRIWIIPSSTGEEAYSIALYLLEYWPLLEDWDVEIISSDIDTTVLAAAQAGLYSARSVHHLPDSILARHFRKTAGGYQISDDLRSAVHFTRVNLASTIETAPYRGFDVVFCRNLLIYFNDQSRRAAAETLYSALVPGGYCCLGHSESMSRATSLFRVRKFPEAVVYQRPMENA